MSSKKLTKVPGFLTLVDLKTGYLYDYFTEEKMACRDNGMKGNEYLKKRIIDEQTGKVVDLYVHRIVRATDIGVDPRSFRKGREINHIDGDRFNNEAKNLEDLSRAVHRKLDTKKRKAKRDAAKQARKASGAKKTKTKKNSKRSKKAA